MLLGEQLLLRRLHHAALAHDRCGQDGLVRGRGKVRVRVEVEVGVKVRGGGGGAKGQGEAEAEGGGEVRSGCLARLQVCDLAREALVLLHN